MVDDRVARLFACQYN